MRRVVPVALVVGAIGLIPATGHGPGAVRTATAVGKGAVRRAATALAYYDTSTRIVVNNHGCSNAGDLTAFGVFWIGGSTPSSWMAVSPRMPSSTPHAGTMHRTSFSHATFTADGGGVVEFSHPDRRVFDDLECAIQ